MFARYPLKSVTASSSMACRFRHSCSLHCAGAGAGKRGKNKKESTGTICLEHGTVEKPNRTKRCRGRGGIVPTLEACLLALNLVNPFLAHGSPMRSKNTCLKLRRHPPPSVVSSTPGHNPGTAFSCSARRLRIYCDSNGRLERYDFVNVCWVSY